MPVTNTQPAAGRGGEEEGGGRGRGGKWGAMDEYVHLSIILMRRRRASDQREPQATAGCSGVTYPRKDSIRAFLSEQQHRDLDVLTLNECFNFFLYESSSSLHAHTLDCRPSSPPPTSSSWEIISESSSSVIPTNSSLFCSHLPGGGGGERRGLRQADVTTDWSRHLQLHLNGVGGYDCDGVAATAGSIAVIRWERDVNGPREALHRTWRHLETPGDIV
ncbi:unnamed protein product [Pleuronectes platessa]|uniref:Uncharacterized protein n=1 Tax=Pleuronectes platessa TaxID=8262 RepID=A0A9N7TNU9_PLEPL|nr:unnamed protein product [Pleuronectes platessa]